jgi:SAM-dependent methyltransferase
VTEIGGRSDQESGDGVLDPIPARAKELLDRFLEGRNSKTVEAYTLDLAEFARFCNEPPAVAIAQLLARGPNTGRQQVLDYARALRRWGRAQNTISRRLTTLRSLVRLAHSVGLADWLLELPGRDEMEAAREASPVTESPHYLLPRHPREIDRLDLQHYAIRAALGAIHQAPVESPALVLDIGAGTGQWGWDLTEELPGALVVGLDLVPGKAGGPHRYQPLRANLLQGLPFRDAAFDFVHQRLLFLGIPAGSWQEVIQDLVRVTRPGGWIELVEPRIGWLPGAGPAVERMLDLSLAATAARGLDTSADVYYSLDEYLGRAGAQEVQRRELELPVGEWGGQVGSLMASDFRALFAWLLEARTDLGAEERAELLGRVQEEYEEGHVTWPLGIAFGQKPR